jgi:hypothetical protein
MSGGEFTAVIANGMATIRTMAGAAGQSVTRLAGGLTNLGDTGSKEFNKIGQAISKMGGPLGAIGGKFFGAAGMEGGLGKLAMAAAAAGVAMAVLGGRFEAAARKAEAMSRSVKYAADTIDRMESQRDAFRTGAEGPGRAAAAAESVWGSTATPDAKEMSDTYGISREEVMAAMAATRRFRPQVRRALLEAALTAAQTGEGSATDFLSQIDGPAGVARVMGSRAGGAYADTLTPRQRRAAQLLAMSRGASGTAAMTDVGVAILSAGSAGASSDQLRGVNLAGAPAFDTGVGVFNSGATARTLGSKAATEIEAVGDIFKRALVAYTEQKNQAVMDAYIKMSEVDKSFTASIWEAFMFLKDAATGGNSSARSQLMQAQDERDNLPPSLRGTSGN